MRPDFPDHIDSSMRAAFAACPMQFYYSYMLHRKPMDSSIHLHFGGALAEGMEVYRKAFYRDKLPKPECLNKASQAIIKFWDFDITLPERSNKTLLNCLLSLEDYFHEYPPETDVIQPYMTDNGPAVEMTFSLPLPGLYHPTTKEPLMYVGRYDMLAVYNGGLYICDEKTAGNFGAFWQAGFRLKSQFTGYMWAAKKHGYNPAGVVVRGISPKKDRTEFVTLMENRQNFMIERWEAQVVRDVRRMIEMWESGVWDYNLDSSCGSYGGCDYMTLCTVSQPEKWMEEYYRKDVWNPLEKGSDNA